MRDLPLFVTSFQWRKRYFHPGIYTAIPDVLAVGLTWFNRLSTFADIGSAGWLVQVQFPFRAALLSAFAAAKWFARMTSKIVLPENQKWSEIWCQSQLHKSDWLIDYLRSKFANWVIDWLIDWLTTFTSFKYRISRKNFTSFTSNSGGCTGLFVLGNI